jgi:hypothetical protein
MFPDSSRANRHAFALSLLALTVLHGGCALPSPPSWLSLPGRILSRLWPTPPQAAIKEPPHIPPLPPQAAEDPARLSDEERKKRETGFYSDLPAPPEIPTRSILPLRDALIQAIRFGILRPVGPQDRFGPERSITYGEARGWIMAYQALLAEAVPIEPDGKVSRWWRPIPPEMLWGEHRLPENVTPTREEMYALYAVLSGQEEVALNLNPDAIEAMIPADGEPGVEDALKDVKDYADISPWARPYVAIAYRDRLPQAVFGLTSARLTLTEGLSPRRNVTRGDVILMLHHLYGTALARLNPHNTLIRLRPRPEETEAGKEAGAEKPSVLDTSTKIPSGGPATATPSASSTSRPSSDITPSRIPAAGKDIGRPLGALRRIQEETHRNRAGDSDRNTPDESAETVRRILRIDGPE